MVGEYLFQSSVLLAVGLILAWWAHAKRLFASMDNPDFSSKFPLPSFKKVRWYHVVLGFAAFFIIQIFVPILIVHFVPSALAPFGLGWLVIVSNMLIALFYAYLIQVGHLELLFYKEKKYLKEGFFTLIVSLPWVYLAGTIGSYIVKEVIQAPQIEQGPITFLQSYTLTSPMFYAVSLFIVTVVPFNEEILFRGLLQSFLTRCNKKFALVLTPLVFAFFHYQTDQGYSNIELLFPLLILAFFLSYLYMKTGSLLATMVFHGTFNLINVIGLGVDKS